LSRAGSLRSQDVSTLNGFNEDTIRLISENHDGLRALKHAILSP